MTYEFPLDREALYERRKAQVAAARARQGHDATLQEVLQAEPAIDILLTSLAALATTPEYNRIQAYEQAKREAQRYVGMFSWHPTFGAARYYEAVIFAIDELLPDDYDDLAARGLLRSA